MAETVKPEPRPMTRRQIFVAEYMRDMNGKKAAIRAGYSPKTAESQASRLLRNVKVRDDVEKLVARVFQRSIIDKERWLKEMETLSFSDMGEFTEVKEDGEIHLIPTDQLPEGATRAIQKLVKIERTVGDGETIITTNLELHDKKGALIAYGKARGWMSEEVKHTFTIEDLVVSAKDEPESKPAGK